MGAAAEYMCIWVDEWMRTVKKINFGIYEVDNGIYYFKRGKENEFKSKKSEHVGHFNTSRKWAEGTMYFRRKRKRK